MFQVDLLPMKTILCGSGDEELLVPHLHGITSGLSHSSVIISLALIFCVPQNASCVHPLKISLSYAVRNTHKLLQRDFLKPLKRLRSRLLSVIEITTAHNLIVFTKRKWLFSLRNAKRFSKVHDGKITITSFLHIQKHSANVLHGLQPG